MGQRIIVGALVLTIISAVGVGVYDATQQPVDAEAFSLIEDSSQAVAQDSGNGQGRGRGQGGSSGDAAGQAGAGGGTGLVQQGQSLSMVGEPWSASGTIADLDDFGLMLALGDGSQVYVELGPPTYWQTQGVALVAGEALTVDGFFNGEQAHAGTITLSDGTQLALRTPEGQPLWAGGASNELGGNGNQSAEQVQIAAEDWVTLIGTVMALDNSGLTMQTESGETMALQIGQATFWQGQGVTLTEGDAIAVLGFWQGEQFQAGEITKVETGERIMLRDPNGRPLWGGPGRSGGGQGGQGGQGNQGQGNQGQGAGGQGQGQGGTGNGNRYRGGRS